MQFMKFLQTLETSLTLSTDFPGYDVVMQFNEGAEQRKRKLDSLTEEEVQEFCAADCSKCNKRFSTIWVLKAHYEEVCQLNLLGFLFSYFLKSMSLGKSVKLCVQEKWPGIWKRLPWWSLTNPAIFICVVFVALTVVHFRCTKVLFQLRKLKNLRKICKSC